MRFLVVGAGAAGGYFGGRLHEAIRDVRFLVRRYSASGDRQEVSASCHTLPIHLVSLRESPLTKERIMTPRLNPFAAAPAPMQSWLDFGKGILQSGLEDSLMELVKIRASQINGCASCLHMHTASARKLGETEERLYLLDAWRESPLYSERERAALGWTEALTLVSEKRAPDDVYQSLQAQFTEEEQVTLTLLIVAINGWNRIQVGFRAVHPVDKRQVA
jgi:AhpD family alkylhydroperoxidase